jgi:hypothetical protein
VEWLVSNMDMGFYIGVWKTGYVIRHTVNLRGKYLWLEEALTAYSCPVHFRQKLIFKVDLGIVQFHIGVLLRNRLE